MKKVYIINPNSGNKQGQEIYNYLKDKIESDSIIYLTQKRYDATEIAKKYKNNHIVYSVGGDGTLNEIVNGLAGGNSKLSIIPVGTGNDFFKSIKHREEKEFMFNLGKANEKYFANSVCIGLDANVADAADKIRSKFIPKNMRYNIAIIKCLMNYKNVTLSVNKKVNEYTLLAVTNGKFYGGGFPICPDAEVDDNKLDLCYVDGLKLYNIPNLFLQLKNGKHIEDSRVSYKKIKGIYVQSGIDIICNTDGESMQGKEFDIKLADENLIYFNNNDDIVKRLIHR